MKEGSGVVLLFSGILLITGILGAWMAVREMRHPPTEKDKAYRRWYNNQMAQLGADYSWPIETTPITDLVLALFLIACGILFLMNC